MRAVIFANGTIRHPQGVRALLGADDLLIAADGGLRHCQALGLTPAALIGDFDSLEPEEAERLERAGVTVVRHPAHKDATDLELALHYARDRGASQVIILGGIGSRWDQSLANLLLLAHPSLDGIDVRLADGPQEAFLLRGGGTAELQGRPGDTVSLLPLSQAARGITATGLEYPLEDGDLRRGSTRGVSNALIGERATVRLKDGLLMCVVIHGPLSGLEP